MKRAALLLGSLVMAAVILGLLPRSTAPSALADPVCPPKDVCTPVPTLTPGITPTPTNVPGATNTPPPTSTPLPGPTTTPTSTPTPGPPAPSAADMIGGSTGGQILPQAGPAFLGLFDTHIYASAFIVNDFEASKAAIPYAGTMSNFTVYLSSISGNTPTTGYEFTVLKNQLNGGQVSIQCSILQDRVCSDMVHSLSFSIGDTITISAVAVGPANAQPASMHWTAKYAPS